MFKDKEYTVEQYKELMNIRILRRDIRGVKQIRPEYQDYIWDTLDQHIYSPNRHRLETFDEYLMRGGYWPPYDLIDKIDEKFDKFYRVKIRPLLVIYNEEIEKVFGYSAEGYQKWERWIKGKYVALHSPIPHEDKELEKWFKVQREEIVKFYKKCIKQLRSI